MMFPWHSASKVSRTERPWTFLEGSVLRTDRKRYIYKYRTYWCETAWICQITTEYSNVVVEVNWWCAVAECNWWKRSKKPDTDCYSLYCCDVIRRPWLLWTTRCILFRTADYSSDLCGKFAGRNCRGGTEGVFSWRSACYSAEQRERRHVWEVRRVNATVETGTLWFWWQQAERSGVKREIGFLSSCEINGLSPPASLKGGYQQQLPLHGMKHVRTDICTDNHERRWLVIIQFVSLLKKIVVHLSYCSRGR